MVLYAVANEVNREKENQNRILYYNSLGYAAAQTIHRKRKTTWTFLTRKRWNHVDRKLHS